MKFFIDDLPVIFPYDYIYPEQYSYMVDLKKTIDAKGHCVLEMPCGTGKTISLLSLIVAYIKHNPTIKKLIYGARTVHEIEKTLCELKSLQKYRQEQGENADILAVGLASRKNLCIHPEVSKEKWGRYVDAKCRNLTTPWIREKATDPNNLCQFFETLEEESPHLEIPTGVYMLEDLKDYGKQRNFCPYYFARKLIKEAQVVVYSFHYLLDPKVADMVSRDLPKDSIVVFDEAHNIDNVCIESLSLKITRPNLDASSKSIAYLSEKLEEMKQTDMEKIQNEYEKMVEGLRKVEEERENREVMANPVLPDDILQEAIPGNIRKAEFFISFMRRFVEYLKMRLRATHVVAESPLSFLHHLREVSYIEKKPLRFCSERLGSLIRTLELTNFDELYALKKVAEFATLVATYLQGFTLIMEPFENDKSTVPNPILHFCCLDASLAIKPVFEKFSSVVITSGTLSPLEMYPKMLQFHPLVQESYAMTLTRNCVCPLIITRGSDQVAISSKFEVRNDPAVVRNYGNILVEMCKIVPDGLVCFFPSYIYMESIVAMWNEMGILNDVWKNKLIFVETPDALETSLALQNYRLACNNGRGAVMFSVARGKVSEGIDFDHNYGRAVMMFGIPYQYTESRILKARLEYLRNNFGIRENDFLTFDAMRHAAQCIGRVLRGKTDYGLMIFADKRLSRADKRSKLPKWITQHISESTTNLSTDTALEISNKFLRSMAQPFEHSQLGISLLSIEDVTKREKIRTQLEKYGSKQEVEAMDTS